jgi:hypothetical protein
MAIADDVLIDYVNKRIYGESTFLSGSTFYATNEVYTYVMTTIALANQMDDNVPFSSRSNILNYYVANGWYFQQALTKHLKGASLMTDDYTDSIRVITLAGAGNNIVAGDIGYTVTGGTTGDTGTLLDVGTNKIWVRMVDSGDLFDDIDETLTCHAHTSTQSGNSATGEELFSNVVTVGTVGAGYPYVKQNGAILTSWWGQGNVNTNHIDVLIKVKEADTLIDSGTLEIYNRNHGYTFDNSSNDCSAGGRNTFPLATEPESAAVFTLTSNEVAAYVHSDHGGTGATAEIKVEFGTYTADINENSTNENYKVKVTCDSQANTIVAQALQWICNKDKTATTLNSVPSAIYQYADGSYTPNKKAPFGALAGSTLIFARGVYPVGMGTGLYIATDTGNLPITPPSMITIAVTGLVAGDNVAVFKTTDGVVDKAQYTSHATSNDNTDGEFDVQETIPKDTPSSGYIRVVDTGAKTEQRYEYASWSGSKFTLASGVTLSQDYDGDDTAYVGYIDEAATGADITKSVQAVETRTVLVRCRNSATGGNQIIPFEVASTIGATGMSVPASHNPDYVIGN